MPLSVAELSLDSGRRLAVAAEALYLVNLMLLPGLAFVALCWLFFTRRKSASPLARCHLMQTFSASVGAGLLLVVANLAIVMGGGYGNPATWIVAILWFTLVHSSLILLGVVGLVKAMAGQEFVFPVVGWRSDARA